VWTMPSGGKQRELTIDTLGIVALLMYLGGWSALRQLKVEFRVFGGRCADLTVLVVVCPGREVSCFGAILLRQRE